MVNGVSISEAFSGRFGRRRATIGSKKSLRAKRSRIRSARRLVRRRAMGRVA